jgi:hypothetical protein
MNSTVIAAMMAKTIQMSFTTPTFAFCYVSTTDESGPFVTMNF